LSGAVCVEGIYFKTGLSKVNLPPSTAVKSVEKAPSWEMLTCKLLKINAV
jgi:hypothetical protein